LPASHSRLALTRRRPSWAPISAVRRGARAGLLELQLQIIGQLRLHLFTDHPCTSPPAASLRRTASVLAGVRGALDAQRILASELGCGCDRLHQRILARGRVHDGDLDRHSRIVVKPGGTGAGAPNLTVREDPVFHLLVQNISLKTLDYSVWVLTPAIRLAPTSECAKPSPEWTRLGPFCSSGTYRFTRGQWPLRRHSPEHRAVQPSIEQLYSPATAPGLGSHRRLRSSVKECTSLRLSPRPRPAELFRDVQRIRGARRFHVFVRTLDYRSVPPVPDLPADPCAGAERLQRARRLLGERRRAYLPAVTRNLEGSFTARFLMNQSITPAGHVVPSTFSRRWRLGYRRQFGTPELPGLSLSRAERSAVASGLRTFDLRPARIYSDGGRRKSRAAAERSRFHASAP